MMVPLYAARIEDLGPGDFVRVDCAACGHTALSGPGSRLGQMGKVGGVLKLGHLSAMRPSLGGCSVVMLKSATSVPDT
jgi:hypothetical protein